MPSSRLEIKEIFRRPDMSDTIQEISLESGVDLDTVDGMRELESRCLRRKHNETKGN
jgi:hypothetical protein